MDLDQFNIIPNFLAPMLERVGGGWKSFRIIPIESGRGCPYGCEFCTVTGFFGDSIRFRTNESVVDELLRLKARAERKVDRSRYFLLTITSPLISSVQNRCCATSSPQTRRSTGRRRSAPICCVTKSYST